MEFIHWIKVSFLLILSITFVTSQSFEEEMQSHVQLLQELTNEYQRFFNSVEKSKTDTTNLFQNSYNRLGNQVKIATTFIKSAFDQYITNKNIALDNEIKAKWKRAKEIASNKKTNVQTYNMMVNLNLSDAYWLANINKKN